MITDLRLLLIAIAYGVIDVAGAQGNRRLANGLSAVMTAYQASVGIDAHMQELVDRLKTGDMAAWQDIGDRIHANTAQFLGIDPGTDPPPP